MWIYHYASFGPGHQSHDYGFKRFHESYSMDDIEESLHNMLNYYDSVVLEFWEINKPPSDYVRSEIKDTKERIRNLKKYLRSMQEQSCFYNVNEKEGEEDAVLIRNITGCIIPDLLERLHKAGFMYGADDISNWRYGKKCLIEPERSKVLAIMRSAKKYPSYKKKVRKAKHSKQLDDIMTSNEQNVLFYFEDHPDKYISPTEIGEEVGGENRHSSWGSPKCLKLVKLGFLERNEKGWYIYRKKK